MLKLCYLHPDENRVIDAINAQEDSPGWMNWMNSMVTHNPDIIWFYTIETTDIWDDEKNPGDRLDSGWSYQQAQEYYKEYLVNPCPVAICSQVAGELCDTRSVWIHLERIKLISEFVRHTPDKWCEILGAKILDPDGWRGNDGRSWTDAITREEFDERFIRCTVDSRGYMPK